MLRMLLGSKTVVTNLRRDQSIAMKEEYHTFRAKGAWAMLVVPGMLITGIRRADKLHAVGNPFTLTPALLTCEGRVLARLHACSKSVQCRLGCSDRVLHQWQGPWSSAASPAPAGIQACQACQVC
jgi:hypothetical protein